MGANLGVLASLMQTMTPTMPQYDPLQVQQQRTGNQTGLIKLAQLKQSQASEEELMLAIKNDPEVRAAIFGGGSTIASLPTTGAPPPAGPAPITQSPLGGGPAQQIPAYPDASRFAEVSPQGGGPIPPNVMGQVMPTVTPPQSTIASLGQPQGQMQGPQNPLLEMARRDPRAALMLQQQMQTQQDRQWKQQEQQLGMGVKVSEFVARELQGVTDQASLDQARERVRQVHPQAAAQMPQMYSKEAVDAVQQRGVAISDMALWKLNMAKARKANVEADMLPKLLEQEGVGGATSAPGTATQSAAAPATGTAARTAPPEYESAITEANRLYPQVSTSRIKSIIAAESNFDAKAVSSAGAKGLMQLMDGTAKDMGVDDPFNVQQNVRGGTRYYAQMLTKYGGDERKALAAYNWGPGNLDKVNGDVSKAPPETQAYVNRVMGGGGAGGGTGTTGTSQAPPEDPRVSGLRAQIKHGQAKAKQYALLGYESMATQYSKDVDDLQKEVERLEAPRRAYETKLATAGIEKDIAGEQGRQAAQIAAENERAPTAEIDAINRGLPEDKKIPYGTTRAEIQRRGLRGAEPISEPIREKLLTTTTAIQQFEELSNAVGTLPTGPLTQYVEQFKERWGIDISDEKVAQRALLAGATNQLLSARNGAAISPSEHQRLLAELPNEANDPKVFKARLANTVRQFKNIYKTRTQFLRKSGVAIPDDLMEPLAAPEAPPAPKVSTAVDKARDIMKPR